MWEEVHSGKKPEFSLDQAGVLRCGNCLCVLDVGNLRRTFLEEAHYSRYTIHPGSTKMYQDLKQLYWCKGMKRDIGDFVSHCLVCQQVKAEHQRPAGLLQQIEISEWKWERVTMDFVTGLPRKYRGFDSVWVIVDRMTKSAHFLPVKTTCNASRYAKLYVDEIFRLHEVPTSIISDRGPQFTSHFWKAF